MVHWCNCQKLWLELVLIFNHNCSAFSLSNSLSEISSTMRLLKTWTSKLNSVNTRVSLSLSTDVPILVEQRESKNFSWLKIRASPRLLWLMLYSKLRSYDGSSSRGYSTGLAGRLWKRCRQNAKEHRQSRLPNSFFLVNTLSSRSFATYKHWQTRKKKLVASFSCCLRDEKFDQILTSRLRKFTFFLESSFVFRNNRQRNIVRIQCAAFDELWNTCLPSHRFY